MLQSAYGQCRCRGLITLKSCFSAPPDERDVCRGSLLFVAIDLWPQVEARSLLTLETLGLDGALTGLASWLATELVVWCSIHMSLRSERRSIRVYCSITVPEFVLLPPI